MEMCAAFQLLLDYMFNILKNSNYGEICHCGKVLFVEFQLFLQWGSADFVLLSKWTS